MQADKPRFSELTTKFKGEVKKHYCLSLFISLSLSFQLHTLFLSLSLSFCLSLALSISIPPFFLLFIFCLSCFGCQFYQQYVVTCEKWVNKGYLGPLIFCQSISILFIWSIFPIFGQNSNRDQIKFYNCSYYSVETNLVRSHGVMVRAAALWAALHCM